MNKVWAVTMVRNERDTIGRLIRHFVLEGISGMVISDNLSDDGTSEILLEAQESEKIPIILNADTDPGYRQSKKMTRMAQQAHAHGASWIIPFDADEVWYCSLGDGTTIAETLAGCPHDTVLVKFWNHYETGRDDSLDPVPFTRMKWMSPKDAILSKRCVRWRHGYQIGQGNHEIFDAGGNLLRAKEWTLTIKHFPYRGEATGM
jgi:glycosyltransferase involved in cell wall biosynthesis